MTPCAGFYKLNYYAVGAMGLASSHGLGLALGRPDKRVLVLDGDGSILMNLGSLVTCGESAPANYVHVVFENGTYEANGGYMIPGKGTADLAALARAAGYRKVFRYDEIGAFTDSIDMLLHEEGPLFVSLIIEPQEVGFIDYKGMYDPLRRTEFSEALRNDG